MSDLVKPNGNEEIQIDLEAISAPQYLQGTESEEPNNLPRVALFLHEGKKKPNWLLNTSGSTDVFFSLYEYIQTKETIEGSERTKRVKKEVELFTKVINEGGDEEYSLNTIASVRGRIISMPTYPEFSTWDASTNSYNRICSTIGSFLPTKGDGEDKPYSYIPGVPCPTLFDYKKAVEPRTFDAPDNRLHDYIGSRGEPCKVCISNGHAKAEVKGEEKTCKLKGSIYMVVTDIGVNSRTIKMKPLSSFVDSDGNPIGEEIEYTDSTGKKKKIRGVILHIILSPSSIRGLYGIDKTGKRVPKIIGSYPFAKELEERKESSMSSVPVVISKIKEKTFPQIHIEGKYNEENDPQEEIALRNFWEEESPRLQDLVKPIPPELLSGFKGETEESGMKEEIIEVGEDEDESKLSSFLDSENDDLIL